MNPSENELPRNDAHSIGLKAIERCFIEGQQASSSDERRAAIAQVEATLLGLYCCVPGDAFPQRAVEGVGARAYELTVPKGVYLVRQSDPVEDIAFVLRGDISVLAENGPHRYKGPCLAVFPPSTKCVVHAHEDTVISPLSEGESS